jgi:hypothetical protein
MKKIFFVLTLFLITLLNAQTTVVEGKFTKDNIPVNYKYLPQNDKIVIMDGKPIKSAMILTSFINNINSYDQNGVKTKIIENENNLVNCTFSSTENSFKAHDGTSVFKLKFKYFLNGVSSEIFEKNNFIKDGNFSFGMFDTYNRLNYYNDYRSYFIRKHFPNSFNDFYELSFTNQKEKSDINFVKDDLYLETFDLRTKQKNRVKLEKPDMSLLIGSQFVKSKHDLSFNCRVNNNDSFDMITKSLAIDYKTATFYKTTYGLNGKKLETIAFNTHLDNSFFVYSNNKAGRYEISIASSLPDKYGFYESSTLEFLDDLSVNNYYEDRKNGDVYVYGLFSDNMPTKYVGLKSPNGYYVFKFDKNGTKIWESINRIDDGEDFNKASLVLLEVGIQEFNGNLIFSATYNATREYLHYAVVNKKSGNILKSNKIIFTEDKSHYYSDKMFIINTFEDKQFKKMTFSTNGIIALDLSQNYLNYIKKLTADKTLYFDTIFSDNGIWLVETDNKQYYKVSHLND